MRNRANWSGINWSGADYRRCKKIVGRIYFGAESGKKERKRRVQREKKEIEYEFFQRTGWRRARIKYI